MKISNASKKVLCGALSAAMVVAFSPAVALGATNTGSNAWYDEIAVGHNLDNGVVTKAPTCCEDGIMTYTCADGDGYTVTAAIARTGEHDYKVAEKYNEQNVNLQTVLGSATYADCNFSKGVDWNKKVLALLCANGEYKYVAFTDADVTTKTTPATFYAAGQTVDTLKVTYDGHVYTATRTTVLDQYAVTNAMKITAVTFGTSNTFATITLSDGQPTPKTQDLVVNTTSKVTKTATENAEGQVTYTAEAALPEGVFFNAAGSERYGITIGADVANVSIVNGKIIATKIVATPVVETHTAAAQGAYVGTASWSGNGADATLTNATGWDAAGEVQLVPAHAAKNTPEQAVSKDGVTISYSGPGSIAAGTASDTAGYWTIEAKCQDHGTKTVVEKQVATSVKKDSCAGGTVYTIAYAGGEYKLTGCPANSAVTTHAYALKSTVWNYTDASGLRATLTYKCAVDGDEVAVVMTANGASFAAGFYAAANNLVTADKTSVAPTCKAKGSLGATLTLKSNETTKALIEALGEVPTATFSGVLPVATAHTYKATVDFVGTTKAIVKVVCSNGEVSETKTYDLSAKHSNVTYDAKSLVAGSGYTDYTADITLPEGVDEVTAGDGVFYNNKTKSYYVKKSIQDTVKATYAGAWDDSTELPTSEALTAWNVAVTDSTGTKNFVPTAISVADVAHTKDAPDVTKAYTLTYDNGKTVTVDVIGSESAHVWKVDHYQITGTAHRNNVGTLAPDVSVTLDKDAVITEITPILSCECGTEMVEATAIGSANFEKEAAVLYGGKEIAKVILGQYIATGTVYSNEPTFEWFTNGATPTAEATFVSADGKMKVTVPCKVTLTDASTSTWTATVEKRYIPEGFSGKVLTDTKVINLHEGHSMVLTDVVKATTSKAGFATYYCNNCAKEYKVVIAKNDMKVSPTSKSFKASAVKKAAKSFTIKVTDAKGKVSYKSSSKKVTVSSKGKVTVKKGTAKGTYKVTVTSKATDTYAKVTKTVTIKVK